MRVILENLCEDGVLKRGKFFVESFTCFIFVRSSEYCFPAHIFLSFDCEVDGELLVSLDVAPCSCCAVELLACLCESGGENVVLLLDLHQLFDIHVECLSWVLVIGVELLWLALHPMMVRNEGLDLFSHSAVICDSEIVVDLDDHIVHNWRCSPRFRDLRTCSWCDALWRCALWDRVPWGWLLVAADLVQHLFQQFSCWVRLW